MAGTTSTWPQRRIRGSGSVVMRLSRPPGWGMTRHFTPSESRNSLIYSTTSVVFPGGFSLRIRTSDEVRRATSIPSSRLCSPALDELIEEAGKRRGRIELLEELPVKELVDERREVFGRDGLSVIWVEHDAETPVLGGVVAVVDPGPEHREFFKLLRVLLLQPVDEIREVCPLADLLLVHTPPHILHAHDILWRHVVVGLDQIG